MDNSFSKLEEAQRIYFNPTLDLIRSNADLSQHCYFHVKKYPKHDHPVWNTLSLHQDQLDQLQEQVDELLMDDIWTHNLKLASQKNDLEYIEFLQMHQPKKKITLKLKKKTTIIDSSVADLLGVKDAYDLTGLVLKRVINQYIFKNKLQQQQNIVLDDVLQQVLKYDDGDPVPESKQLHFFALHRRINLKYLTT